MTASSSSAALQRRQRGVAQTSSAPSSRTSSASAAGAQPAGAAACRRAGSRAAGRGSRCPACARRAACPGSSCRPSAGRADQHELAAQQRRIDLAFEHVDRRDEAVGAMRASSRRAPRRRARCGTRRSPTRQRRSPTRAAVVKPQRRRATARRAASRSRAPAPACRSTLATSGMRRTTPRVGSTEISPRPLAARSSSSMLVSAPACRTIGQLAASRARRAALRPMIGAARSGVAGALARAGEDQHRRREARARRRARASFDGSVRSAASHRIGRSRLASASKSLGRQARRLRASGCRARSPPAGAVDRVRSAAPAGCAATATGRARPGSSGRSRRPSPAATLTWRGASDLVGVEPGRLQPRRPRAAAATSAAPARRASADAERAPMRPIRRAAGRAAPARAVTARFPSRRRRR